MPVVALAMGAASIMGGMAAAGTLATGFTLAGLAGGASVLGGAAMALGAIKGGPEGDKWISQGGILALAGNIGTSMLPKAATTATTAAQAATPYANATTTGAAQATQSAADIGGNIISGTTPAASSGGMLNGGLQHAAGTGAMAVDPAVSAAQIAADSQRNASYLQLAGGMLSGDAQQKQLEDAAARQLALDRERFNRHQYRPGV